MARAVYLAQLGGRAVQPNPMVGCVLVKDDRIIGEGWHRRFGGPHAEVLAIQAVTDTRLLQDATAYISLEPCTHHGKTPPCTDILLDVGLTRVVVACQDANPQVQGKGIARLRAAGLDVVVGVLEKEARLLNRRFFTYMEEKRPYIILKWAQSTDGFLAPAGKTGIHWLSTPQSQQLVHLWRSQEQAILVGYRTALADNPRLTVRSLRGMQPLRVIMDKAATLPNTLRVWDDAAPTVAYTHKRALLPKGYISVKKPFVKEVLASLHARGVLSLLVEGGAATLLAFLAADVWDEARIITCEQRLEAGVVAPQLPAGSVLQERYRICGDNIDIFLRNVAG